MPLAGIPLELAVLGPGVAHPGDDLGAVGDHVLDGHLQVREGGDLHPEERLDAVLRCCATGHDLVLDEVVCQVVAEAVDVVRH